MIKTTAFLGMRFGGSAKSVRITADYTADLLDGGIAHIPYNLVRKAMDAGLAINDPNWPPHQGYMSPPEPIDAEAVSSIPLPDGTELAISRPFHQVLDVPLHFMDYFESQGWVRLSQFA